MFFVGTFQLRIFHDTMFFLKNTYSILVHCFWSPLIEDKMIPTSSPFTPQTALPLQEEDRGQTSLQTMQVIHVHNSEG